MTRRLLLPSASALVALTLALTGCGGSGSSSPEAGSASGSSPTTSTGSSTGSGTSSEADSTSGTTSRATQSAAVVQGVRLTADGSSLRVGDTARVSWKPDQKTTGVIAVKVTGLDKVPMSTFRDWQLKPSVLASTPYFVHARVRNLGRHSLAGVQVPLYVLDQHNVLLEASTFRASFEACPSTPFPEKFTQGKAAPVCLVYFAPDHGKLEAVSFRPSQKVDGITWRGPVTVVKTKSG